MEIIRQNDMCDCGAACLYMIAAYYNLRIPLSSCRVLTKTNRRGTSLHNIVEGAEKIGLKAIVLSGTAGSFLEGINNHELTLPVIAHISIEKIIYHFIVLFSFVDGIFTVGDPAYGMIKMTESEFTERWTGYIITFHKTE